MDRELARLSREHPLPPGWSSPQLFGDEVRLGELTVRRAGIECRDERGVEATGSAAQVDGSPLSRAWFELLERIALVSAGERDCVVRDGEGRDLAEVAMGCPKPGDDPRRRPSRSNGVALHRTWARACEAARLELLERDRVLRAWCGELELEALEVPTLLSKVDTHEWRTARVVSVDEGRETVAVVIGFPRRSELPLTRGFAARRTRVAALAAAAAEAVQSLAFICDEPVPSEPPALEPTPMFHLDHYLWPSHHAALRQWLDGGHRTYLTGAATPPTPRVFRFLDLTPPGAGSAVRVARALAPESPPLMFGELPEDLGRGLPPRLRVHPIA